MGIRALKVTFYESCFCFKKSQSKIFIYVIINIIDQEGYLQLLYDAYMQCLVINIF